jgi:hypothetical protein
MPVESSAPALEVGVEAVSSRRRQSLVMTSYRSNVRRHPWIFDPAIIAAGIDDPIDRLKALVHREASRRDPWAANNNTTGDDFRSQDHRHRTTGLLSERSP